MTVALKRLFVGVLIGVVAVLSVVIGRQGSWTNALGVPSFRQKGNVSAPVVMLEFSDFQCGNCAKAQLFLKEFLEKHRDKIRFVFRHHPLKSHKWAAQAAWAADCAGAQGRFWEYHDILFEKQSEWAALEDAPSAFVEYAGQVGLDVARFEHDFKTGRWRGLLENDVLEGSVRGISATPTFFLKHRRMVGESQLRAYGERFLAAGLNDET